MISDRYLKRSMSVFGPLVAAVFISSIGLANSLPVLLACVILGGIGTGVLLGRRALECAPSTASHLALFINVSATALTDPVHPVDQMLLLTRATGRDPHTVVLEISEREPIADKRRLRYVLASYREHGIQFAIDDVGDGPATLDLLAAAMPEYIKLSSAMTSSLADAGACAAVEATVAFARESSAQVIAEGWRAATPRSGFRWRACNSRRACTSAGPRMRAASRYRCSGPQCAAAAAASRERWCAACAVGSSKASSPVVAHSAALISSVRTKDDVKSPASASLLAFTNAARTAGGVEAWFKPWQLDGTLVGSVTGRPMSAGPRYPRMVVVTDSSVSYAHAAWGRPSPQPVSPWLSVTLTNT